MTQIKAILLNGPPRSGKDTAANAINDYLRHDTSSPNYWPFLMKNSEALKQAAHVLFGEPELHPEAFDSCKDEPNPVFLDKTPRQVYISLAEEYARPKFGVDFFSKISVRKVLAEINKLATTLNAMIINSDLGFVHEAQTLVDAVGASNIAIIQLYRNGTDFSNDSRSYIELPGVQMCGIANYDDVDTFKRRIKDRVRHWLQTGDLERKSIHA